MDHFISPISQRLSVSRNVKKSYCRRLLSWKSVVQFYSVKNVSVKPTTGEFMLFFLSSSLRSLFVSLETTFTITWRLSYSIVFCTWYVLCYVHFFMILAHDKKMQAKSNQMVRLRLAIKDNSYRIVASCYRFTAGPFIINREIRQPLNWILNDTFYTLHIEWCINIVQC